jgi:hypothetical protein
VHALGFNCEWRFLPHHNIGIVSFSNRTSAEMTMANTRVMDYLIDNGIVKSSASDASSSSSSSKTLNSTIANEPGSNSCGHQMNSSQQGIYVTQMAGKLFDVIVKQQWSEGSEELAGHKLCDMFAPNVFLDKSESLRRRESQKLLTSSLTSPLTTSSQAEVGGVEIGNVEVINNLRGSFIIRRARNKTSITNEHYCSNVYGVENANGSTIIEDGSYDAAMDSMKVFFSMTPENPPRIQEVKLELLKKNKS